MPTRFGKMERASREISILNERSEQPEHISMNPVDQQAAAARGWMSSPRFDGITRLYSARDVAEQEGTIRNDYTIARRAAEDFFARLRELFEQRKAITTFGPY